MCAADAMISLFEAAIRTCSYYSAHVKRGSTTARQDGSPLLPCPECTSVRDSAAHVSSLRSARRIGVNRRVCGTCNSFAQAVRRLTANRMRDQHPEEWMQFQIETELALWPQFVEQWTESHPSALTDQIA